MFAHFIFFFFLFSTDQLIQTRVYNVQIHTHKVYSIFKNSLFEYRTTFELFNNSYLVLSILQIVSFFWHYYTLLCVRFCVHLILGINFSGKKKNYLLVHHCTANIIKFIESFQAKL